jgi:uncharacterized coiled-coil DUF342 family protein
MKNKRFRLVRRLVIPAIVVALLLGVVGHLQAISDYVRLYNFQPDIQTSTLADQTTMTPEARRLFYINHPQIDDRTSFNSVCNKNGEQTIVLGCYHSKDRGIYLFDVTDVRLNGVEQVTAAHEMLHAAYDRLSAGERTKIDGELQNFYDTSVHDQRIRDTMAAYQKSEPDDVVNEMHSIFATEIGTLTPQLESYYSQYFTKRAAVVQFADNYQQEFTSRQDQVAAYDKQLSGLKQQINQNTTTLKQRESEINTMQRQMEADRVNGNVNAYNAQVPAYNAKVDQYNSLIRTTQNAISEYNRIVAVRNDLALQVRELTKSISSQLSPIDQ